MGGDKEDREEDKVARNLNLISEISQYHQLEGKNITTLLKCKVKEHLLYHLKGAQGLEHVADYEEDVGNAEAGEEPVEGGRHRPGDHRNHDEVHNNGILHDYLAQLRTGRSSIWQEIILDNSFVTF